jgi:hypothetical protein
MSCRTGLLRGGRSLRDLYTFSWLVGGFGPPVGLRSALMRGACYGCAEGGDAAGVDGAVTAGEAFDGECEKLVRGGYGGGFAPGAYVRKEPRGIAADGEAAHGTKGVAGVEGAVALVQEG